MKNEIQKVMLIMGAFVLICGLAAISNSDISEEAAADRNYCEMVQLHKSTDGDFGWPDYKHRYNQDC